MITSRRRTVYYAIMAVTGVFLANGALSYLIAI